MVPKKRLDYRFNGRRSPIIPKAPRSIRRRCSRKNSVEDNKLCAFELLAAVAGKLLQERESSVSSNVEAHVDIFKNEIVKGQPIDEQTPESESIDHGSCAESSFMPEASVLEPDLSSKFKGLPQTDNDSVLEHTSVLAIPDVKKLDCDSIQGTCQVNNADGNTNCEVGDSIFVGNNINLRVDGQQGMHLGDDANPSNVKDPIGECVNSNMLIKSDNSVQLPLYRDPVLHTPLQKQWNTVKLGIRDDDDNSFGCTKLSTKFRPFRPQPRTGHRRIRKMLSSKYRKMAPKLRSCELYNSRDGVKSFYQYRKRIYTEERCLQAPIKKRKLFDHRSTVAHDQDASSNSISNSREKGVCMDKSNSVSGASTTVKGHKKVKFSIKSFKVPELYIEVPETTSVGSLKRTVMEALTALLGSGVRVGVVLQGKKVRDDNRTLQQAGISQNSNLDTLGFTLEPSFTNICSSMSPKKLSPVLPCDADQELLRSPATPMVDSGISNTSVDPPYTSKVDEDVVTSDFMSTPQTPTNETVNGTLPDSKALVPVSPTNSESLAVVPANPKPKRSELSQRRTRRPFSVGEVEALVEAVERLGTGRWRDVKMGAFEHADHRTYVDLKDKWKTLVHTAGISPHQRRGEPVPQDLLDRVLAAHSYWSLHQSKQHGKQSPEPLKTVDPNKETVGGA
ncbi:telomere repeat-binding protein 4 isoform X2 [Salvia miltiorrhiza]|uniref:telomere repeat-binding protein 4 isoform X2 n=1 Tax=Salvia miltiorrhiza TaxID=226208 RepID=UPI0025AB8DE8|nr:telomere repeat-binding protein 4 isoform X2 [Salvia miltiorrhiza]XP_057788969.1 telomere repeat-binding protein 4 isoform X2 [Salvia miltiorrhiza]